MSNVRVVLLKKAMLYA